MSIEHSDISFGEMHPVANWVLTSGGVAALGSIAVSDADIGKVVWVAGAGHFVLAAVAPTLWETLGLTLSSAVYADQLLTLTFSDNSTVAVEILSMSAEQVQAYVEGVLASYVTGSALTDAIDTINNALSGKEPTIAAGTSSQYWRGDKTWQALNTGAVAESTNLRYLSDAEKARVTSAANTATSGYLTRTDWNTFNGKQNALADVITANTYGNSAQYPVLTVNATGIVTGITLQAVQLPTITDATFAVQRNGSPAIAATWSLSAFTASHIHTYPDKDINFGNLSFIATTDSNTLGGTRNRIAGGSGNSVSGTDNIVIGCIDNVIEGDGVVALSKYYTGGTGAVRQPRGTTVLGTSLHPTVIPFGIQSHYGGACAATLGLCTVSLSANGNTNSVTTDGETPANSNTPYLVEGRANAGGTRYPVLGSAVHDVEFIVTFGVDAPIVPSRTFFAKRRVYAAIQIVDGTPAWYTSTEVVGTDANLGTVVGTVTIGFTLDTANNRLVPTVSATGGQAYQVSARVNSHYNRK